MSNWAKILPLIRPIAHLFDDPTVTEVMVNEGGRKVFVERDGRLALETGLTIAEAKLALAIQCIARTDDKEINDQQPLLEMRLEDGSRLAAALRKGGSPEGATLTIRRFGRRYSLDELVATGSLPEEMTPRLVHAVLSRKNMLIAGGTGTGKTTLLNALAVNIPPDDRVVVIEDTAEIHLELLNLVRFEARPALAQTQHPEDDLPAITITQLLKHALRHRPDRILLGEVRDADAADLLQALNTGHMGSMSTIHANTAPQALERFAQLAGPTQLRNTRAAIALVIDLVVHIARVDGRRRISQVITVDGVDETADHFLYQTLYPADKGVVV